MIPLEAEALSLGSLAESGHEYNAYPGYPIEKCSSSECSSSKSSSPCCQNIVAMLLCGRTFQKRCVNTGAERT